MRVFLAGATGVIGQRLLPQLIEGGHQVTAMTRRPGRLEQLEAAGAVGVVGDAYDAAGLSTLVSAAAPDVVIHELTSIPQVIDPRRYGEQFAENDRLRSRGTPNLVAAAVAGGARRIVAQSVAFAYEMRGSWVKSEEDPLFDDAPPPFSRSVRALHDLEDAVLKTPGIDGVVLRYGFFYGPGSTYASTGSTAALVRRRRFPIVGGGGGTFSFIHVDDAAAATVLALDHAAPGLYNIADDEPAPIHDWLPAYARALGAKRPLRVPRFVGRLGAGDYGVALSTACRGASNAKAKRELGWAPRYPSWRTGFFKALG